MKKGFTFKYLISASMLLVLASCNDIVPADPSSVLPSSGESSESLVSSETSADNSDASLSQSAPEASSSEKGTYDTSYLQNAFEESMKKNGMRMVTSQPKLQVGLSSYNVLGTSPNFSLVKGSTNNIYLQADSQTLELTKSTLAGLTGMHYNCNNLSLVAGALSMAGSALPATNIINQDANLYYKNSTLYWDFLDENGQECTNLSSLIDLAFSAAMSATGETSEIEFQHKGKYELDSNTASILSALTSSIVTSMLWSSGIDPMIQSLWEGGAEITTTETDSLYNMSIKTSDPSVLLGGASEVASGAAGSLIGGMTGSLPVDVGSATDNIDEDYFSSFEFEINFGYTRNSLKSMSMSLDATADGSKVEAGILGEEDLKAGDTKMGLETIKMSQSTTFDFNNNITIAYPSFDDYVTQEMPATEEVVVPSSEPTSSTPISEPTSSDPLAESITSQGE